MRAGFPPIAPARRRLIATGVATEMATPPRRKARNRSRAVRLRSVPRAVDSSWASPCIDGDAEAPPMHGTCLLYLAVSV